MCKKIFLTICILVSISSFAQKVLIKGEVYDEFLEPFSGAIVKSDAGASTTSDDDGVFTLKIELPVKLKVSFIGYSTEEIVVENSDDEINLILKENSSLDQIILSASRIPERLFESPVAVERISLKDIKRTPATNFYQALGALKNVDVKHNSMLLQSVNARGFSTIENTRFVQLIDGVDNAFPTTNTSLGNLIGTVDMDVENVEIITGASSALYGANAFNGIMLIKTKNPFDYTGVSVKFQTGFNVQPNSDDLSQSKQNLVTPFYNPNIRFSYKFDEYFAAKASFSFYKGEEWHAQDYRTKLPNSDLIADQSKSFKHYYNGVNVYGDENNTRSEIFPIARYFGIVGGLSDALSDGKITKDKFDSSLKNTSEQYIPLIEQYPSFYISREGYKESDLVDNRTRNIKFNGSLHYRPLGDDRLELSWTSRLNGASSLLTTSSRMALRDASFDQHILDVKGKNFFLRGYITELDAGKSYDLKATANILNTIPTFDNLIDPSKPDLNLNDVVWFQNVSLLSLIGATEILQQNKELTENIIDGLFENSRSILANNRLNYGTKAFNNAFSEITSKPLRFNGAMYQDKSRAYNAEGNFNFKELIDFAEILLGGSFRRYILDSNGGLFTDISSNILIDEYGGYAQLRKSFLDDRLKVTGSLRYDKSKNFKGQFSPRGTVSYVLGNDRNHFFRFSAQSAFRNPRNQDQYIGITKGFNSYTIGNTLDNIIRFNLPGIDSAKLFNNTGDPRLTISGFRAFEPGFTKKSFDKFYSAVIEQGLATKNTDIVSLLQLAENNFDLLKVKQIKKGVTQENVFSFELGYRSIIDITQTKVLEIDFSSYYNIYRDFIYYQDMLIPFYGDASAKREKLDVRDVRKGFTRALLNTFVNNYISFSIPTNSETMINAFGASIGLKTKLFNNFNINASYSWNDFTVDKEIKDLDFKPQFNMPKHNVKLMFGNDNIFKNIGFNILAKWQDAFLWESDIVDGFIPARTTLDAQISYKLPYLKSRFKLGGVNLLNTPYNDNLGSGQVGTTYYLSWIIND